MKKLLLVLLLSTGLYASQENTDNTSSFEDTAKGPDYNDYDSDNDDRNFDDHTKRLAHELQDFDTESSEHQQRNKRTNNPDTSRDAQDKDSDGIRAFLHFINHQTQENRSKETENNTPLSTNTTTESTPLLTLQIPTNSITHTTTVNKKHQCLQCDKSFRDKSDLMRHIRTHTGEKPFKCSHEGCNYSTADRSNFSRHIRRTHTGEKPYQCTQCDQYFSYKHNLITHIQATHNKEKPHQCTHEGCNYSTAYKNALARHIQSHTGEKPHQCPQCDQCFAQKSNLTAHIRATHNKEKPHQCPHCDYSTAKKSYLTKHAKRIHQHEESNDSEHEEDPSN